MTREQEIDAAHAQAARRIFDILDKWMSGYPRRRYTTERTAAGGVQMMIYSERGSTVFFGENVQDAYGQAAQTIEHNEGFV